MELSAISIYPIKSCGGIAQQQVILDRFGPSGDRRWLVVDTEGRFLSQRELAAMALVRVTVGGAGLCLSAGDDSIEVAVPAADAPTRRVTVWHDSVPARRADPAAGAWLSQHLGQACELVYMGDECRRLVRGDYGSGDETVSFADGFPLLLISEASLADLNTRLAQPVPMNRFRPNLVISGCEPFAEDGWQRIRIGDVELDIAKPCARCVVPSIDQATGEKDRDINRVLASFRRWDGQIWFGQNLLYRNGGTLRVGDPVTVLA